MKNIFILIGFCLVCSSILHGQDTLYIKQLHTQVNQTLKTNPPLAVKYALEEISVSKKDNYEYGEAVGYLDIGKALWLLGDYPQSLTFYYKALEIFERIGNSGGVISSYNDISLVYLEQGDYAKTLQNLFKAWELNKTYANKKIETIILINIGETYLKTNQLDSAGLFTQKAYSSAIETNDTTGKYAILNNLGTIYMLQKKYPLSIEHYKLALNMAQTAKDNRYLSEILTNIGDYFIRINIPDSSFSYLNEAFRISMRINSGKRIIDAAMLLQKAYRSISNIDSAFKYGEVIMQVKDSIAGAEKIRQVQNLTYLESIRQEQLSAEKDRERKERSDLIQYTLITIVIIIIFSIVLLLRKKRFNFRFLEILATIGLLLLFEFIALLCHTFLEHITNHTPYLMLIFLSIIAAVLVPLHHYLITLSKKHLARRNRNRAIKKQN